MKNFRKLLFGMHTAIMAAIVLVFVLSSCRGKDGADGADGINNTQGVIYDVTPDKWVKINSGSDGTSGYKAVLSVPEITSDIYNNGAVLVYRAWDNPSSFNMLPYTYVDNNSTTYMDYNAYIGSMDITYKVIIDNLNSTDIPNYSMSFKVVVVQGISMSALKSKIDVTNYSVVSRYLGLKDSPKTIAK